MNERQQVHGWLQELSRQMGIALELQDNGVCAIAFDDDGLCFIEVPADNDSLVVHAPLLALAGRSREAVFTQALASNLFGAGTAGCTIALDERNDQLVLCCVRAVSSLDATSFVSVLSTVIETARRLNQELAQIGSAAAAAPTPPSDPMAYAMRA